MKAREDRIFEPSLFRDYLKSKIISLLSSISGKKLLMLEYSVRVPINLIIDIDTLFQHQIPKQGGITAFEVQPIDINFDQVVVFLSPTAQNILKFKDLVLVNLEKTQNRKFFPVFWPKRTMAVKEFLDTSGLMPFIEIRDFSFDLLPLDIDLYSLEMNIGRDLYIDENHTIYSIVAESIHRLQSVFGRILNIFGKGRAAHSIYQILKLKQLQVKSDVRYGDIEHLIIFDRSSDFFTPLIKQLTYQGLINQFFGISGGMTRVPKEEDPSKFERVRLNSEKDFIFEEVRILQVSGVRQLLKTKLFELDQFREIAKNMPNLNEKNAATKKVSTEEDLIKRHLDLNLRLMEEMQTINFNKELILHQQCLLEGQKSSFSFSFSQKEKSIYEYYDSMIAFEPSLAKIMRSMSLQCINDRGVSKKVYNRICNNVAVTYGAQHIKSMANLAKIGLFYQQGQKESLNTFSAIKKELKLIYEDSINQQKPMDPSFAYSGYCPIFTKLVEGAIRDGWRSIMKGVKMLPGDTIMPQNLNECRSNPRPAVVVYFVGGVTYAQVATIRLLSKLFNKQIIVATTHMINGSSMVEQFLEPVIFS